MSVRSFLVPALLAAGAAASLSACDLLNLKEAPDGKAKEEVAERRDDGQDERQQQACASAATYDRLKELVFDEATRVRNQASPALDQLAEASIVRMERPVVRSRDDNADVTQCSGRFILELPPGAENAFNGERRLTADVDYSAQAAADGSGLVYNIEGAEPIIQRLAGIGGGAGGIRQAAAPPEPRPQPRPQAEPEPTQVAQAEPPQARRPEPAPPPPEPRRQVAPPQVRPPAARPAPPAAQSRPKQEAPPARRAAASPSFNCARGQSRSERMVCGSPGLAALDRQMSSLFYSALADGDPEARVALRRTRDRFLGYRERCGSEACVAQAYRDRMDEIRDIMSGR